MKLSEYDVSTPYKATIKSSERITPPDSEIEVRHIVLDIPHPAFNFVEGQSIGVLVPGPHDFGNEDHFRLYSIASSRNDEEGNNSAQISICVRRCYYIDEVSGERFPGIASNYLCDKRPNDEILVTGPYGRQFVMPRDKTANILMIGVGTGIAPFRAFVKHIYNIEGGWQGKVRLFYGAHTGMELLYMNDMKNDFGQYYTEDTFKAFEAVSPRPHFNIPADLDRRLSENADEVWSLLESPKTYVYVAGLEKVIENLDKALSKIAGSEEAWEKKKEQLKNEGRYAELLY